MNRARAAGSVWLLYSAWVLVAGLGRTLERVARDVGGPSSRYGPTLGALVVCLALLAWRRRWRLGRPWMWSALSWALALASAGALGWGLSLVIERASWGAFWLLAGGLTALPAAVALHCYARRSPDIWGERAGSISS